MEIDLIKNLALPTVLIAPAEMSSINNTIMSIQQAQNNNIDLRGVVLSTDTGLVQEESVTIRMIKEYTDIKVAGLFNKMKDAVEINPNDIIANIITDVDIQQLFKIPIAKLQQY